jgi:sarcosine oxidase
MGWSPGLPIHDTTIDPTTMERRISDESLAAARPYIKLRFPALAEAPMVESRVCQYENSTDQNFIVDHHPEAENAWIAGGGSGHRFKHGPAMGDMVSDAVLRTKAAPAEFKLTFPEGQGEFSCRRYIQRRPNQQIHVLHKGRTRSFPD